MNMQGKNPTGQRIPNGMLVDNYPRNMWWVAAYSEEVTTKPITRWLLETPVVLYALKMEQLRPCMTAAHTDGRLYPRDM